MRCHAYVHMGVPGAYIVQKRHSVTTVNGKHQGEKAKKAGLKCCHTVLEIKVEHMSCEVEQMWMRIPSSCCSCGCDEEKFGQAECAAKWRPSAVPASTTHPVTREVFRKKQVQDACFSFQQRRIIAAERGLTV